MIDEDDGVGLVEALRNSRPWTEAVDDPCVSVENLIM